MEIVRTQDLTKTFGSLRAVDRVSLVVAEGEAFGLLGPNGAGKTTTIKMLTTLLPPTSGTARVAGYDVVRHPAEVRRSIGYVPQMISSDPQVTGYENLWVFARLYQIPRDERDARIREGLDRMGLSEFADVLVKNYSGGMIRRLEMAQSLLHRPRVLIMDEPTVGLDPLAREALWQQIARLREVYGTSIILTTHYMEEADRLCDRLAIFSRGKVVATGSPQQLKDGLDRPDATLGDVFAFYAGEEIDTVSGFKETQRVRRVAIRLK